MNITKDQDQGYNSQIKEDKATDSLSLKSQPSRFFPIFFDMGMLHVATNYFVFPRSLISLSNVTFTNFRGKLEQYLNVLKSKQTLYKYIKPSILTFLYRGCSFATYDYLNVKNQNKYQYFLNGAIAGVSGLFMFKFAQYFFRLSDRLKLKGYVYLQILHSQILYQNIKDIFRDKQFTKNLIKQIPLSVLTSGLFYGGFYYWISLQISNDRKSIQNLGIALLTTTMTEFIGSTLRTLQVTRQFSNMKINFKQQLQLSINYMGIIQQSILLYLFHAYIEAI